MPNINILLTLPTYITMNNEAIDMSRPMTVKNPNEVNRVFIVKLFWMIQIDDF